MSEIDRGTSKSSGRKEPKIQRIIIVASIAVVLFASSLSLLPNPSSEIPPAPVPAIISYTNHNPILITNDTGFNATNGLTSGSGIAADPYIISGWNITASSANGIQMQNTNAYFVVRDCYVHGGGGSYSGIRLINCANGTLNNNSCSNDYVGIWSSGSICDVNDNNCSNNLWGIYLSASSSGNTLINNTCNSNSNYGLGLNGVINNVLINNTCNSNTLRGIYVSSSSGNTLTNNTCANNQWGINLYSSSGNTLSNNTCNSNTQCGIYLESSSDSNTISNNTCWYIGLGIGLSYSDSNTLSDNDCSNGYGGIGLEYSSGNTISNNTCNSNSERGIFLGWSSGNNLTDNTCNSNSKFGIFLWSSSSNILSNNICHSNTQDGMRLASTSNGNNIDNNNCSSNSLRGVYIDLSGGNILSNNTCLNNIYGIHLDAADSGSLFNNTCSVNTQYGIVVVSSNSNTMFWNKICNNSLQGIYLMSGSNNRIWNNTFIGNNGAGSVRDPAHIQAYDTGTSNWWNTSGTPHGYGNYWSDWTTPDSNFDGIVDKTYNITGSVNDSYPLTTPSIPPFIPEFSEMVIPIVGLVMIALIFSRTRRKA